MSTDNKIADRSHPSTDGRPRQDPYQRMVVLFAFARRSEVDRRAAKVGLVVGTVLVAINHGDRILAGDIGVRDLIKIGITYLVPYCVCTYGCVTSMSNRESEDPGSRCESST